MRTLVGVVVLMVVVAGVVAATANRTTAETADLASLAWLSGAWSGAAGKMEMEEVWMAPKGGAMLGLHRDVAGGRMVSFEFLRIVQKGDVIDYIASPGGRAPTVFTLKEQGDRRVVFENPSHDYPQKISYWIDAGGALHARIEGDKAGKRGPMEWTWRKDAAESRPK
jgi:hypothetical protein